MRFIDKTDCKLSVSVSHGSVIDPQYLQN